ncbi:Multidrug-efflux transporter 3 [Leminorella richardii]|uniref:Multidrug-efflux transporter 3 n=1 Tax=Leminorella richardii TaxID=158841 RepID=A0A2X4UXB2_9GAMM|nr:MFS transporter [Leminorella richardii]SQI40388.1 Multidrug-efflux transporter 3 [Leminorella richardii]
MTETPSSETRVSATILMVALLAACVAFQLNASMLGPVLVTIAEELHTDEAAVSLSQTAFFTAAALFSLFLPRLSDIKGRKKVLSWMLAIMTAGTVLAALAPNITVLYIARVIQGVSGPVVPLCLLMLRHEISDAKVYGTLMGVVTAVNGGIAGIDAIAGGVLAANFGFRSVFWTITVVAAIATLMVMKWAPESKPSANVKMDWPGVILLVLSLAAMLIALGQAGNLAAANWLLVFGLAAFSVVMFIAFWQVEKRSEQPLVTTHYLKQRSTWALLLTTTLTMTGIFAVVNGLVMSLAQNQNVGFGMGADTAALAFLTPYALIGWLVGPFSGRLAPTLGYNRVLRFGLIGSLISLGLMAMMGLGSLPWMIGAVLLIGVSYAGIANIMLNGLGIVLSPKDNPGFLPGMNAGAFNLGAGLSFALLPAVQIMTASSGDSVTSGYANGILVGLGITVLALLTSFLIPRPVSAEVNS